MKPFILTALAVSLLIAPQAMAKPTKPTINNETPIRFAKGSTCGSFDGNVAGRVFTLQLDKGQQLYIDIDSSKPIMPQVADPRGKSLSTAYEHPSGTLAYRTTTRGKYTVQFEPDDPHYPFAEVKFCAY